MRIRVYSTTGWNTANRQAVIDACQENDLPFIDRAGVLDPGMDVENFTGGDVQDTHGLDGYVFFAHRGMTDLPFDRTVQGAQ